MTHKTKTIVKVPATSANLGPGFDSMGLAVDKFLTVEAEISDSFSIDMIHDDLKVLPTDETNLVLDTAIHTARIFGKELPHLHLIMDSEIPLSHGLGSSSSAIVAGIELANHFCSLSLSEHDKVMLGCNIEGHPDNIGPCITGGIFVGYFEDGELFYQTLKNEDLSFIISVPHYEINTDEARKRLPNEYHKTVAVSQNALNNVMLMSLVKKDYTQMGELMMRDRFHEPFRQPLIREFNDIKHTALEHDAYATTISGAGPSVMSICSTDNQEEIYQALQQIDTVVHEKISLYNK
jgi:homoserine kinase